MTQTVLTKDNVWKAYWANGTKTIPRSWHSGDQVSDYLKILNLLDKDDLVFYKAVTGSGKSLTALHCALHYGGAVIAVPSIYLSEQYSQSYEQDIYLQKDNGSKLNIVVLKGRDNFPCLLYDGQKTCADPTLPCTRSLGPKETRRSACSMCPHWIQLAPYEFINPEVLEANDYFTYSSATQEYVVIHSAGEPCPYFKQYYNYEIYDSIIVMNYAKFAIELNMGRLPIKPLTIIDEGDFWLDNLAEETDITPHRISHLPPIKQDTHGDWDLKELWEYKSRTAAELRKFVQDVHQNYMSNATKITKEHELYLQSLKTFFDTVSDKSYDKDARELAIKVGQVLDHSKDAMLACIAHRTNPRLKLFIPMPHILLQDVRDKLYSPKILLMSSTMQPIQVMKELYHITPATLLGRQDIPGTLHIGRPEDADLVRVTFANWDDESFQDSYKELLSNLIKDGLNIGKTLVIITAKKYIQDLIIPKECDICWDMIHGDKSQRLLKEDIDKYDLVFSTRLKRGADLGMFKCMVVTKKPIPFFGSPLIVAIQNKYINDRIDEGHSIDDASRMYWRNIAHDFADRELEQYIGRLLRSDEDVAVCLSPDSAAYESMMRFKMRQDSLKKRIGKR